MRDAFSQIMQFQPRWSADNTSDMQERGKLIRDTLPNLLRHHQDRLQDAMGIPPEDFAITGKDGTGLKTQIPWVRFNSLAHSPRPTNGWYCVYLFDATGSHLYLALAHGSTRFINGEFKPRSAHEVGALVYWAKALLNNELTANKELGKRIQLNGGTPLGEAYANSTVAAILYSAQNLPSNEELIEDAEFFARMLGRIYSAEAVGAAPESESPELVAATEAIAEIANPLRSRKSGQGFGLSAPERRAVELRAMTIATDHWKSHGYTVKDVSAKQSYDLEVARNGAPPIYVEVKGTTSGPDSIMLTANEVTLHQYHYPNTALVVVHGISLNRTTMPPLADGGTMLVLHPWSIEDDALTALSYRYDLPTVNQSETDPFCTPLTTMSKS